MERTTGGRATRPRSPSHLVLVRPSGKSAPIIMKKPKAAVILHRIKALFVRNPNRFLKTVSGVIHVGANTGQERDTYRQLGLHVVWIEPIPEVFHTLKTNLAGYSGQIAFQYLVSDRDNSEYTFHIANNDGASSSILDFNMHKDIWPDVAYEREITLQGITLPSLIRKEQIKAIDYQALVLDTQGSELLVLQGADAILRNFEFIKIEVADFESYKDCCQVRDIENFLKPRGFREFYRHKFAERIAGGNYYDIVYKKAA
jgi:FkbM family methyltransferase